MAELMLRKQFTNPVFRNGAGRKCRCLWRGHCRWYGHGWCPGQSAVFELTGLDKFVNYLSTRQFPKAIISAAGGLGLTGKRPVAEIVPQTSAFACIRFGTRWKFRYMFGGKMNVLLLSV